MGVSACACVHACVYAITLILHQFGDDLSSSQMGCRSNKCSVFSLVSVTKLSPLIPKCLFWVWDKRNVYRLYFMAIKKKKVSAFIIIIKLVTSEALQWYGQYAIFCISSKAKQKYHCPKQCSFCLCLSLFKNRSDLSISSGSQYSCKIYISLTRQAIYISKSST